MTLFLIGNGFDLNCGMNTRFSDVYKEYVNSDSKSPIIEAFKREISLDIDRWGDFEMEMCDYAQSLKTEKEFVECVRDFSVYMREYLDREQKLFFKRINDEAKEKNIIRSLSSPIEKKKYVDELYQKATSAKNYVKESYLANYHNFDENYYFQDIKLLDGTDFEGKIDLHKDASLAKSDCRIEWENGGVELKGADQLAKVADLLDAQKM